MQLAQELAQMNARLVSHPTFSIRIGAIHPVQREHTLLELIALVFDFHLPNALI